MSSTRVTVEFPVFLIAASMIPPQFLDRLQTREVAEGESVRFTVRVKGKPPPDVKWYVSSVDPQGLPERTQI